MITIVFVIPLISKQRCSNWELRTQLLQGTLDSLDNQDSSNFKVIVGCNEIPNVTLKKHPDNLHFVPISYDPSRKAGRDKLLKICNALLSVSSLDFRYCMELDADDRVHKNLVKFLENSPQSNAFIIDKGYQLNYKSMRIFPCNHLSNICGSTTILSREVAGVPQANNISEFTKCFWQHDNHSTAKNYLTKNGIEFKTVPFNSLQYVLSHSLNKRENSILKSAGDFKKIHLKLKKIIKFQVYGRAMSEQEQKEFGW